ncbi:MAG TPA: signal peptide peptidase SppA [Kofleriaceae bacterium]|nr:signal peptide peptidase SppA [Kofleriaceae bacterium]
MRLRVVWIAALVACHTAPSKLDSTKAGKAEGSASDPWASALASHAGSGSDDDKGFDLQNALARVKEGLEKPGPYETPLESAGFDEHKPHVGVLKIHGDIVERESFSWTGGHGTELRRIADRLRQLAKEPGLTGLVVRVEPMQISLTDALELRAAMHDFRAAGKRLVCHADSAANTSYLVLAACDRIGLSPLGDVAITGPAAMPIHVKPLLDRLGVEADFLHVGAYKGAAEPLTRDAPSKEMEETLGAILDRRYATMVETIAAERKLDPATVRQLIDTGLFTSEDALAARLVDEVTPFEAFRDELATPWQKLDLDSPHSDQLQSYVAIARFLGAMPPERPIGDHVALVYAIGDIVDGSGDGVLGAREQIAAQTLVPALRALAADDSVKAVVMRVDSPGGSAQASELIWHAVTELRAKKPVIVSMSDVAASGGYYISSGATKVFALDDTLTGSIGVVGGKLAIAGALGRVGVLAYPMGRGKHATMMGSFQPWTDDEKSLIGASMQSVYKQFVARVAEGRHQTVEQIQPIAQGRVWTGAKAKELGLVDAIGGLDAALAAARALAKVAPETDLEVYPPTPTLRDVLAGFGQVRAALPLASAVDWRAELAALDPHVADAAQRLIEQLASFRGAPIQTLAILPVLP